MSTPVENAAVSTRVEKEWTLMFYFASDNPLAPGIVSQLKSIKQAGFHHEVNVVAQFDPQPEGTPTHVFDVNHVEKLIHPKAKIGFVGKDPCDPVVVNLIPDKLWRDEKDRAGRPIRERLKELVEKDYRDRNRGKSVVYEPPTFPPRRSGNGAGASGNGTGAAASRPGQSGNQSGAQESGGQPGAQEERPDKSGEAGPQESLCEFLRLCRENYPARHYMLFILGHGVVVGNDVFLYDENADQQSLSLKELADELTRFKGELKEGAEFELISFHSCSVSSLEVAHQLRGTANYMLASQGPAFVGSWPYRQILMRMFRHEERRALQRAATSTAAEVKKIVGEIFKDCYDNSLDFLVAGYSFDLCLCDLKQVGKIEAPLKTLANLLAANVGDPLVQDAVLLAHLRAQSHWQESYTDLYDFCFCLRRKCESLAQLYEGAAAPALGTLREIAAACLAVEEHLESGALAGGAAADSPLVLDSQFAGPGHQYSHGLSVYFPWSEPSSSNKSWREYEDFSFCKTDWLKFLKAYFDATRRDPRKFEDKHDGRGVAPRRSWNEDKITREQLIEDLTNLIHAGGSQAGVEEVLSDVRKLSPRDPTGDECTCASIKNYPRRTLPQADAGDGGSEAYEKRQPTYVGVGGGDILLPRQASTGSGE